MKRLLHLRTKFAHENTTDQQLRHMAEEAREFLKAWDSFRELNVGKGLAQVVQGRFDAACEAVDFVQSTLTLQAIQPDLVRNAVSDVIRKNTERGYYLEPTLNPADMTFAAAHPQAPESSQVDHPDHYGGGDNPYEAIKVIIAWGLNFCLGNVVKYVARAGKKQDRLEDLKKARKYLDFEIAKLEGEV